ncbi:M48 family metallopeptidase [Alicycliphilus denitrificans]|uniref:M48 family metallopeptidase n=1 Tax=Alicycliphilus denitrificans TaxID=179636 RepID=A0A858ZUL7_9BURK|nr:SprT family zinc-dependent metalloprotease [Alicycliphilus denitrificans]QKD44630.1 M48 family metallopeptidase [Alicycliphilus denitrificans]
MPESPISFTVERSNRKTIGLYVERDGSVLVRAPLTEALERIKAVVDAKQKWIYRAQARWAALNPLQPGREFVSGETVYLLGQPHRLDFRAEAGRGVQKEGDLLVMRRADRAQAEELLKSYFRTEGLKKLPKLVQQHAQRMGLSPGTVRVQELGHRWGSCSAKGNLNFNWKAMAAPVEVLRYLVVHELAHLRHKNHSSQFWHVVETEMPDWARHAEWLTEHGAEMVL